MAELGAILETHKIVTAVISFPILWRDKIEKLLKFNSGCTNSPHGTLSCPNPKTCNYELFPCKYSFRNACERIGFPQRNENSLCFDNLRKCFGNFELHSNWPRCQCNLAWNWWPEWKNCLKDSKIRFHLNILSSKTPHYNYQNRDSDRISTNLCCLLSATLRCSSKRPANPHRTFHALFAPHWNCSHDRTMSTTWAITVSLCNRPTSLGRHLCKTRESVDFRIWHISHISCTFWLPVWARATA